MARATVQTKDVVAQGLTGRKLDLRSRAFEVLVLLMLLGSLAILVVLLADIFRAGWGVLAERGTEFVRSPMSPVAERAGVWQGIAGSFLLMAFVVALAFPVGIAAAVYLEEYAKDTAFNRFVTVNIRNLAGVPSVVYGLLGLAVFVRAMGDWTGGNSIVSGGITLAILVLPIVIITSSEALRAVPGTIREAAFGVGATQWETIRSHVLPYAAPGILTGTVLSLARAIGETAPLLMVGAVTGALFTGERGLMETIHGPFTALPTIVFSWARQPGADFQELTSAAIIVLLALVLTANAAAIVLRNRYQRREGT
jgi:phosphate transport system permease protein